MLLTEVLVAIAVVAQAKHRHHEKKRDQAGRREDDSTVTVLQFSCPQTLLLLSPVTTEDLEIVLIVLLWRSILPAWLTSTLHSSRQLVKGALSEKEPIRSSYSCK